MFHGVKNSEMISLGVTHMLLTTLIPDGWIYMPPQRIICNSLSLPQMCAVLLFNIKLGNEENVPEEIRFSIAKDKLFYFAFCLVLCNFSSKFIIIFYMAIAFGVCGCLLISGSPRLPSCSSTLVRICLIAVSTTLGRS